MADDLSLVLRAADFAARKHRDQRRKNGNIPYVNHVLGVAHILAEEGGVRDPVALAAALLHDTLEDTATTADELAGVFGAEVAGVVREVTDDKRLPKAERKRQQIAHAAALSPRARLVKLADKLHNLRDLATAPPAGWDAARIGGYFCWAHAVVAAIGPANEPLWRALDGLFAGELTVGGATFRAVPADAAGRARVLADYLDRMARVAD